MVILKILALALFRFAVKSRSFDMARDVRVIDEFVADYKKLINIASADSLEAQDLHVAFLFRSNRLDKLFSTLDAKQKDIIRHAIESARILYWSLRFSGKSDPEIVSLENNRVQRISKGVVRHNSYEALMREMCESGWPVDQAERDYRLRCIQEICIEDIHNALEIKYELERENKYHQMVKDIV